MVERMSLPSRRFVLTGAAASAAAFLVACSDDTGNPGRADSSTLTGEEDATPEPTPDPVLVAREVAEAKGLSGDAAGLAAAVSGLLLERSRVAVLAPEDDSLTAAAATLAAASRWPVLVGDAREALPEATVAELSRLGVEHVVQVVPSAATATATATATSGGSGSDPATGTPTPSTPAPSAPSAPGANLPASIQVTTLRADEVGAPPADLRLGEELEDWPMLVLVSTAAPAGAALATLEALGARALTGVVDPREDATVMGALRESPALPIVSLAADEQNAGALLVTGRMAQRAPELPGGGVTLFPHRRMVALYGHPGSPVLGLLGEQGIESSIERIGTYVDRYSPLVAERVIPAFEIIASVATAAAQPDNSYSHIWPPETFRAWVDAAKEAGVYVVLDLQPGRTDFLTQAKAYVELLVEPHVGLALDPEWRLGPDERHLVRIGSVDAAEINSVSEWLAELVREHDLPQKVLTLHQFRLSMIRDRDQVRTDHPEIAVVLHADGQGGQAAKQDTWRTLKADLPDGMWLGWKNFYDEDSPMLTPEQTVAQVDPTPWFISYQ